MVKSSSSSLSPSSESLPVVIVGAGPCGLVAALVLQKKSVPFVIVEKASRAKICSNAGSGFELAGTAIDILKEKLGLPTHEIMLEYAGMYISTMEGKFIRDDHFISGTTNNNGLGLASVNRAELQLLLLKRLFPTPESEDGKILCGVGFESYEEDVAKGQVMVKLTDKSSIVGKVLLGCDGINSRVRKCMHGGDDVDPLRFCECICYWGKCKVPENDGSDLEKELNKTQSYKEEAASFVVGMTTRNAPGCFFLVPTNGILFWALMIHSKEAPKTSDDMTRRGGKVLDEISKLALQAAVQGKGLTLLDKTLENTKASDITEAGLFDRKNLDLPYTSPGNLVALLGDAAHPQTPFLGQGVNMAITDAYVLATRLAYDETNMHEAISQYDSPKRRNEAKGIVKEAYNTAKMNLTSGIIMPWFLYLLTKILPLKYLASEVGRFDKSNREMVQSMEAELKLRVKASA